MTKDCPTCNGNGCVTTERKTLGGIRTMEVSCFSCYGSGKEVIRTTYKGIDIAKIDENSFYMCSLQSEYPSLERCHTVLDQLEVEMAELNNEMDDDEKFTSLKDYCEDYLRENDSTEYNG